MNKYNYLKDHIVSFPDDGFVKLDIFILDEHFTYTKDFIYSVPTPIFNYLWDLVNR